MKNDSSLLWQMDISLSIVYDLAKKSLFINVCDMWLYLAELLFGNKAEKLPLAIKFLSILLDTSLSDRFHFMLIIFL